MSDSTRMLQRYFAGETEDVFEKLAKAVEDLSDDELHHLPHAQANSIGFDAWHVSRTVDNIVNFAFHRERPVWLQKGLDEDWGLPRVDQGTGMEVAEAQALRFPGGGALGGYIRAVSASVVPKLQSMSDEFLAEEMEIKFQGSRSRATTIGNTVIVHTASHMGHIDLARTLFGKPGLGI